MTSRRSSLWLFLAGLVAVVSYLPAVGRGFVSEDFLILRRLTEAPFWVTVWEQFTGPWLGTSVVLFYRPVASFLLLCEVSILGLNPTALAMVQLGVHLGCSRLVFDIGCLLQERILGERTNFQPRLGPLVAAGLFLVYPMHPNAVVWVASFVNLFSAFFLLLALRWYLEGRDRWALVAFLLALGCYEATAIFPLLLVLVDVASGEPRQLPGRAGAWRRWVPFFVALAGYLALRWWLLGAVLGGYPQTRERLLGEVAAITGAALASPAAMLFPGLPIPLPVAVAGTLAVLVVVAYQLWKNRQSPGPRIALLGLGWVLVAQLPFGFVSVVPANGRFWYLPVVGLCLLLLLVSSQRWLAVVAALVGLIWVGGLVSHIEDYRRAGVMATKIQSSLQRQMEAAPRATFFFTRYPPFVSRPKGVPAAQVFTWGLRDAMGPPFQQTAMNLYPLPPMGDGALAAVFREVEGIVLVWDPQTERVHRWDPPAATVTSAAAIPAVVPESPARGSVVDLPVEVRLPLGVAAPTTLFLSGESNPHRQEVVVTPDSEGRLLIPLPSAFLAAQAELYGGSAYWWLETRDEDGRLRAVSRARRLEVQAELFPKAP